MNSQNVVLTFGGSIFINKMKEKNPIKYLDYKNGLKLSDILKSENQCYRSFWINSIKNSITDKKINDCIQADKCLNEDECQCVVFEGFGSSILERSIKKLNNRSRKKLNEACKSIIHSSEWEHIAEQLIAWGIAPMPVSA